jgi:mRNA (guanine-N7-)-methyltransferase
MNEKRTKPIPKKSDWVEKPQKASFEDQNWEEPEAMARNAPINKNVYIDQANLKSKSKSPDVSENYGITDPELLAFYKSLNEIQQGIVKKMPTQEDKIRFLNFVKEAKEKEAAKLAKMNTAEKDEYFKNKEIRKEQRAKQRVEPKKKTSSPLEEFLKEKKFSPVEQQEILTGWNMEMIQRVPDGEDEPYTPPKWLKDEKPLNSDEIRKLGKNDGWGSPSMYNTGKPILDWGDLPKQQNEWGTQADWGEVFGKDADDEEDEEAEKKRKKLTQPQIEFEKIVTSFYGLTGRSATLIPELEVRFGTRGINKLTKNDYDNVIQKLKSSGFVTYDSNGLYSLRIQSEFIEPNSGKVMLSPIRTEIEGSENIQKYCNNNSISELLRIGGNSVKFNKKTNVLNNKDEKIWPVNFDDFNFRVSLQNEEILRSNKGAAFYIIDKWKDSKKTFRYLNRVTFSHPDYPILVDISITKSTELVGKKPKTYYSTSDANIFNREEIYEIELEVNNRAIGPGTRFNNPKVILESLRKVIKFVLSGLQGTNFPVSYPEQKQVLSSYMELLHKDKFDPNKWIHSGNFIGPNPITLQLVNISPVDENSTEPNIRDNFVVTDKADGDRNLMYISDNGKIYLINTNMNVIFTGAKSFEKEYFNSILDGELIHHNKNGVYINLYAAFDIYYLNKTDVRALTFVPNEKSKEKDQHRCRYMLLKNLVQNINVVSIEQENSSSSKSLVEKFSKSKEIISPIRIECKKFYPEIQLGSNIFDACNDVLTKADNNLFEYTTDGLIFTPAFLGVGSNKIGEAGPIKRVTWKQSFKWKPPHYNTIDFLVTTIKNNGNDLIEQKFEEGLNVRMSDQISENKVIQLRCTFDEGLHGYINPCQDIIDDKLPEHNAHDKKSSNAKPVQFYPTEPYDPEAGITKIMLRNDGSDTKKMFTEEDQVFEDNTIVEFSYDQTREKGWRWTPLRVRYDKTSDMLKGKKNFGNSYDTAESNWKSIHFPITEDMIRSGLNISSVQVSKDKYYNKGSNESKTEAMKNFHNLYVKKLLIKSVSKSGETLIDYACGKAGDLPKWIDAKLSFVFGIDVSKDNLENRLNGSCTRYLNARKENKNMPYALFVHGNTAQNIRNGSAMLNDKAIQITQAVFGNGPKDKEIIGPGVSRQFGKGQEGFNVSSCQFALHYFFKNPDTLQGFLRNLSECTKYQGYFIGTAYDGKTIFDILKKKNPGESVEILEDGKKIWEIIKSYDHTKFLDDSSSIGYRIDVYQESINQLIPEYLINFNYLQRIMLNYGFQIIDLDEARSLGLPQGCGFFSELFDEMTNEISKNKFKASNYGMAPNMTSYEKKISFLNKYFVFKKINKHVNAEQVQLELGEYNEIDVVVNKKDTYVAVEVAKEKVGQIEKYAKVKKLNRKLLLVPGTEAIEEMTSVVVAPVAEEKKAKKVKSSITTTKKKLRIED